MSKKEIKPDKARYFASILYPESARRYDLINRIRNKGMKAFISPLHTPDPVPEEQEEPVEGELPIHILKPHYHVLFVFDGPRRIEYMTEQCKKWKLANPQIVTSYHSYARYLCHLDDPDKQQWKNFDDVTEIGGIKYSLAIQLRADKDQSLYEILHIVEDNCILDYKVLIDYCMEERPDLFRVLMSSSVGSMVTQYMRSMEYQFKRRGQLPF